jgi:hypothetical protein
MHRSQGLARPASACTNSHLSPPRLVALLLVCSLVTVGCGGSISTPRLASDRLLAELVDVPGYAYAELNTGELLNHMGTLPHGVLSAAFRTVHRVDARHEVAFLVLYEFPDASTHEEEWSSWSVATLGGRAFRHMEVPTTPDSRYQFVWFPPNVLAYVDGPDDREIRRWLEAHVVARGR